MKMKSIILMKQKVGLEMVNCKDPMDIAKRIIKQDDNVLRALNNGHGKAKKT